MVNSAGVMSAPGSILELEKIECARCIHRLINILKNKYGPGGCQKSLGVLVRGGEAPNCLCTTCRNPFQVVWRACSSWPANPKYRAVYPETAVGEALPVLAVNAEKPCFRYLQKAVASATLVVVESLNLEKLCLLCSPHCTTASIYTGVGKAFKAVAHQGLRPKPVGKSLVPPVSAAILFLQQADGI